jgi:transmembrane sensor
MNLPPARRLASYMEPEIDEKRIDRVWAAVSANPVRVWPVWRFAALAGVAAAAAVLLLVLRAPAPAFPAAGWVVESSAASNTVTLSDGTRATLHDAARLRWDRIQADRIEATVERGPVAFDVRHDGSRAFVVHAAGVDLVDRGTRFIVDVEGNVVSVSVQEGQVEVTRGGARTGVLSRGDTWTNGTPAVQMPAGPSAPGGTASPATPGSLPSDEPTTPPAPPTAPAPDTPIKAPESQGATPQELLQTANDARLAGRAKDAASAFDLLRRRYRNDPRAGLAAFELGRLRLDSLGDPSGAAEALADAVALAPSGPFREDADARLVEAFDRMHNARRCAAARHAYLARYPGGLHAAAVAARCP